MKRTLSLCETCANRLIILRHDQSSCKFMHRIRHCCRFATRIHIHCRCAANVFVPCDCINRKYLVVIFHRQLITVHCTHTHTRKIPRKRFVLFNRFTHCFNSFRDGEDKSNKTDEASPLFCLQNLSSYIFGVFSSLTLLSDIFLSRNCDFGLARVYACLENVFFYLRFRKQ